eukprot:gene44834-30499_t
MLKAVAGVTVSCVLGASNGATVGRVLLRVGDGIIADGAPLDRVAVGRLVAGTMGGPDGGCAGLEEGGVKSGP